MINTKLSIAVLLLYGVFSLEGMESARVLIPKNAYHLPAHIPSELRKEGTSLMHDDDGFKLLLEGKVLKIPNENIKSKKNLTTKMWIDFVRGGGYFSISRNDEGDVFVRPTMRGKGGGPVLGQIGLWGTRVVGYGAFGLKCYLSGGWALAELEVAHQAIETAAHAAWVAGTLAPTA